MNGRMHASRHSEQSGVGLIEVLVAVLILSIGVLGMAALQATSLSTNNSAMMRSMSTIDSYSIIDAMRADLSNATAGNYNTGGTPLKANACGTATAGDLVSAQKTAWCNQLGTDLGKTATTTGAIDCAATGACTITVTFDDSRAGLGGSSTQTLVTKGIL